MASGRLAAAPVVGAGDRVQRDPYQGQHTEQQRPVLRHPLRDAGQRLGQRVETERSVQGRLSPPDEDVSRLPHCPRIGRPRVVNWR